MPFRTFLVIFCGAVTGLTLPAQRLRIVSEFQRYMPSGEIVPEDKVERPREIISPAAARNAHLNFRIVVQLPAGCVYNLHIAQNPDGRMAAKLYQETYQQRGESWIPTALKEVPLSLGAEMRNQTVQTYLLDLWAPSGIAPQRIRVEVQLNVEEDWTIVPVEVRVSNAIVSPLTQQWASLKDYACGAKELPSLRRPDDTLDWILFRNAQQDIALARGREKDETAGAVAATVARAAGFETREAFCVPNAAPPPRGAEWLLKARDYLIQGLAVR